MFLQNLRNKNIILASGSPRRKELFKKLNLTFKVVVKEVEEKYVKNLKKEEITNHLALLKLKPFTNICEKDLIITADTIVWHNKKALGKPQNRQEAFAMLASLSGKTHQVISSVAIKTSKKEKVISDVTKVIFKTLTVSEINYYLEHFKPYDKAGAYGIQEWIGLIGIKQIKGSYFNVMGLPVYKLYEELLKI